MGDRAKDLAVVLFIAICTMAAWWVVLDCVGRFR
jgi:hypothetical protein